MIRYVDSSGWTWAVWELADRLGAIDAADAAPPVDAPVAPLPFAASSSDGRMGVAPGLADRAPAADADDEAAGELYFFSRLGTRKLRGYPASWSQLSRAGLEALCAAAEDVGASGQPEGALA